MAETLRVFVSSVMRGMESEREAARTAIASMHLEPWTFETLPAYPDSAREVSLALSKECDLFVQLIGPSVSPIVVDEYQAAMQDDPTKVLVLSKMCSRDPAAAAHLKSVSPDHKYGKYKGDRDLPRLIQDSIAAWISKRAGRASRGVPAVLPPFMKTVWLWPGRTWTHKFDVKQGDRVRGLVQTSDQVYTFDAYLFTEKQWADWRNDPDAWDPDAAEVIAFPIDRVAKRSERWYLVVKRVALLPLGTPMAVKVEIGLEPR